MFTFQTNALLEVQLQEEALRVLITSTSLLLSSALVRPGRFDMQVTVPHPDVKGRTEILNWYLSKIKVDSGSEVTAFTSNSMKS